MKKIMHLVLGSIVILTSMILGSTTVFAQNLDYTVISGDSMWKIAVKYEVGVSEIASANPQVMNPNLIYPGQKLKIPSLDEIKNLENRVIALVNAERAKVGISPLKGNWQLSRVARYKSQDMIDKKYFSHTSPTYGSPFDMMKNFGFSYRTAGENIAKGQQTPEAVMNSWMNSSGHRANILNGTFTEIGVGVAKSATGELVWTQMFITR